MPKKDLLNSENAAYLKIFERLKFFESVSLKITERKPLSELLDEIIITSQELLKSEAASLLLYHKSDSKLHFHTVHGDHTNELLSNTLEIGEGLAGSCAKLLEPFIINECYSDERFNQNYDKRTGFKTRNMICCPMIKNGSLVGVIQVMNKKDNLPYDNEDRDLFYALASQCAVSIENERLIDIEIKNMQMQYELDTARHIQEKYLQQKLPSFNDIDMSIKLIPAKEVGGDYFSILKITPHKTLIFIGDVAGKSIPAALIVPVLYSFINSYTLLRTTDFNLIDFTSAFNKFLITCTTADKYATAWLGLIDHKLKTLESINAGHNPTMIINKSGIKKLESGGFMLGVLDAPYISETEKLNPDDLIVFYTDGVTEAMDIDENEFGEERFENFLLEKYNQIPEEISIQLFETLSNYRAVAEQSDDITLGIMKIL
ncbi:MAG: SpoIIE family protein phosphatase [Melioribacteraceae bacterium]|nr:SpoIIE family protein phosphatase [Melioribacteraceae bacterium]